MTRKELEELCVDIFVHIGDPVTQALQVADITLVSIIISYVYIEERWGRGINILFQRKAKRCGDLLFMVPFSETHVDSLLDLG